MYHYICDDDDDDDSRMLSGKHGVYYLHYVVGIEIKLQLSERRLWLTLSDLSYLIQPTQAMKCDVNASGCSTFCNTRLGNNDGRGRGAGVGG